MTPATQDRSAGSRSNAPTSTSDPRGSLTIAERKRSCCSRNRFRRSDSGPPPSSGPPLMTTRVGSPAVWESITWMRCIRCLRKLWTVLDAVVDNLQDRFPFLSHQWHARRAHPFSSETAFLHGQLDVLDKFDVRVQMQQRREPAVDRARFVPTSRARQVPEKLVFARERQTNAGDPAINAQHRGLEHEVVHTDEDGVAIAEQIANVGDAARIAGALLQR